jgi:hypothetical protein
MAGLNPPAELEDELDSVIAAVGVLNTDLQQALDAAEAGDLDAVNSVLATMNERHVPAVDEAEQKVMDIIAADG